MTTLLRLNCCSILQIIRKCLTTWKSHISATIWQCRNRCQWASSWSYPGPVFCLLLGVSSDYAQPITGQVTEVTWPVIGWAQPELTSSPHISYPRKHVDRFVYTSFSYQGGCPDTTTAYDDCPSDCDRYGKIEWVLTTIKFVYSTHSAASWCRMYPLLASKRIYKPRRYPNLLRHQSLGWKNLSASSNW